MRTSLAALLLLCSTQVLADSIPEAPGKIPITTASADARALYLRGRGLFEKLAATDAHKLFEQAVAKDPDFALAHIGLAQTSGTPQEFFAAVKTAVGLVAKVSEGERMIIEGLDAGARGEPDRQRELYEKLTRVFPGDERAHNLLGNYFFGRQDWALAIASYQRATTIAPAFSPPYNQLGYAYRFLERYDEAEKAFVKYIELIPGDPNPYDSYAELLMKTGRYDESIARYQKALILDPNFVASYIGIATNQMFLERYADARKTAAKLLARARRPVEKRQAFATSALSWIYEGKSDRALAEVEKMMAVARAAKDLAAVANDLNFQGNILLEAGDPDRAKKMFDLQAETVEKAAVPQTAKDAAKRNARFDLARVALAKNDLATARTLAAEYVELVAQRKIPFEVWQSHELLGRIALAEKKDTVAVAELLQANQQDPRVLFLLGVAMKDKGRDVMNRVAQYNGLNGNYAFVRRKAKEMLGKS